MTLDISHIDWAVSRAIGELHEHHDLITADIIADHIHSSKISVARSISRLKSCGYVRTTGGSARGGGFRYEVIRRP